MATHMERIGVEPHMIEVCLGHVLKGVAGTYRQYGYLPEKTAALQAWADELLAGCERQDACTDLNPRPLPRHAVAACALTTTAHE